MNKPYKVKVSHQVYLKKIGNIYFSWPKLFNTFSHILTSFFLHNCIHSIIPHQYVKIMHIDAKYWLLEHF